MSKPAFPRPCRKCNKEFKPAKWQTKKHDWICKECRNVSIKKQPYYKNVAFYNEQYRKRPYVKESIKKQSKVRRERPGYKERAAIHNMVSYSVILGKIIKRPCEVCGTLKVDGHHPNYKKPLEVIWLCRKHHIQVERQAKKLY